MIVLNNKTKHQEHPQISRIPFSWWKDEFKLCIDEHLLPLLQDDIALCVSAFNNLPLNFLSEIEKKQVWLLTTLWTPKLSFNQLDEISKRLNLRQEFFSPEVVCWGNVDYLNYLFQKNPSASQSFWDTQTIFSMFQRAATYGHLSVLLYIESKTTPEELQKIIAANDFEAFKCAARSGQLPILGYIESKIASEQLHFEAFECAAFSGQVSVLNYIESKINPEQFHRLKPNMLGYFLYAAESGHIDMLRYIESKVTPQIFQRMIASGYTEEKPDWDAVGDYDAFKEAAYGGHLDVIQYLVSKIDPQELTDMLDNHLAYGFAAQQGHLHVLQYLASLEQPEQFARRIIDTGALGEAVSGDPEENKDTIDYLLQYPLVLGHAECHEREFSEVVIPFITGELNKLHGNKTQAEALAPTAVFDINTEQARAYFYMLRNLIRRNDPALLDEIRFLLSIPAIKNLAHRTVTPGRSNELLRLALTLNNVAAAELLLTLPEVHTLAQQNQFYRHEVAVGLDLQELAQDRESSMTALSTGEQKRLKTALDHYNPKLKQEGAPHLITALKDSLKKRFETFPATIEIERDGSKQPLELPMAWDEFALMDLTPEERTAANQTYYKHKDHSAWRYLSKPNPWMHKHAGYVYISDDRTERWSTFEEYQPLIALLFLAAKDDQVPAIDDFTIDTRLEHFITELALIGRAHNWDTTRFVTDAEGNLKLDEDGQPISEEFDDLEGDRPSCFSGVKRRLFQSLKGHPMFQVLVKAMLESEVRSFVRQHFETNIPKNNPQQLQNAWNELIEGNQEAVKTLKVLDISTDQQQGFLNYLNIKYGLQFTEEPEFIKQIEKAFKFLKPENDCHVVYFSLNVGLQELLEKAVSEQVRFTENPCILFTPISPSYTNNPHEDNSTEVKEESSIRKSLKRPYSA